MDDDVAQQSVKSGAYVHGGGYFNMLPYLFRLLAGRAGIDVIFGKLSTTYAEDTQLATVRQRFQSLRDHVGSI